MRTTPKKTLPKKACKNACQLLKKVAQPPKITSLLPSQEELQFLAYHDPLTEVGNRELLFHHFEDLLAEARQNDQHIAILSLAPDGLGEINAVSGQAVGDAVLTTFAKRVGELLSPKDLFVRMAGHRFVVVLTGLSSHVAANKTIGKILKAFEKPIKLGELEFDITVTIGVCFFPSDGKDFGTLISHADAALDSAKAHNRGTATIFSEELSIKLARKMRIYTDLKTALAKGEIEAYYQPQVNVRTGEIVGIEALARWPKEKGIAGPCDFIPVAEERGLIDELTWQILTQICQDGRRWQRKKLAKFSIAINISGMSFKKPQMFLDKVEKILKANHFSPKYLELELTESAAMLDPAVAISIINRLKTKGVSCSIDDFGTGYSSLSVLKTFPLKKLKIDRSFILDLNTDKNDGAIVKATIAIARALGLTVLAEGVESKKHYDILKAMGCDVIQGYLFSAPIPAAEMEKLLLHWNPHKVLKDLA